MTFPAQWTELLTSVRRYGPGEAPVEAKSGYGNRLTSDAFQLR